MTFDEPTKRNGDHSVDRDQGVLSRFIRLAAPFFSSEERWRAGILAFGVVALTLVQIGIQVRFNFWNRDFFNALEARDWTAFTGVMTMFLLLAGSFMVASVYQAYLKQLLQLRWRRWLTVKLVDQWLENGRHYQLHFVESGIDNPDQRIAENVRGATEMAVEFVLGILNAVLTIVTFVGILWSISGALHFTLSGIAFDIPGYMVWAALIYAAAGSFFTYLVGRPIVAANMGQNMAEADYRFALVRLHENSEGVALIRGEKDEREGLSKFFENVMIAAQHLMFTQRRLMWLTSAYGMVGMIYPTIVASPKYFAHLITLGELMQITSAFGQVQGGLNWFVDNFPRIAEWRAHVERLLEFEQMLDISLEESAENSELSNIVLVESDLDEKEASLVFEHLRIAHADGNIVVADANTTIAKGERVLIVGDSGSGKSTLFRAIAGLWPWGAGKVIIPARDTMMFLPQRSYLPLGTLRAALSYPAPAERFSDDEVKQALERCGLGQLLDRLDDKERWDRVLSVGEQQRVAFARVLLHKPNWVFMDEATSALDDNMQNSIMRMFTEELPSSTLISIAHRAGLDVFHSRTLTLVKSASGARLVGRSHPSRRKNTAAGRPAAVKTG